MNPLLAWQDMTEEAKPRSRGDEPGLEQSTISAQNKTPLTRG